MLVRVRVRVRVRSLGVTLQHSNIVTKVDAGL